MLSAAELVPFLRSPDELTRRFACEWLRETPCVQPVTADDAWAAIDAVGDPPDAVGKLRGSTHGPLTPLAYDLPQTEASVRRALANSEAENVKPPLLAMLRELPFELALKVELLFEASPLCDTTIRRHFDHMRQLLLMSSDDLWNDLRRLSKKYEGIAQSEFDFGELERRADAIARQPGAADRAMAVLNADDDKTWMHVFALPILGRLRYRPAVPRILHLFNYETAGEAFIGEAKSALAKIGTSDVVTRVTAKFPFTVDEFDRGSLAETLGHIRLPESVDSLKFLAKSESEPTPKTLTYLSLCQLCPGDAETLEMLRQAVLHNDYDAQYADLSEDVLAAFAVAGRELPEAPAWRADIEARDVESARRMAEYDKPGGAKMMLDDMRKRAGFLDDFEDDDFEDDEEEFADDDPDPADALPASVSKYLPPVTMPIQRQQKVGRNDPCPCGSGKKYKKCCLRT